MNRVFELLPDLGEAACCPDYDCGGGHWLRLFSDASRDEFKRFCDAFARAGFEKYDENAIGSNLFATFVGKAVAYIFFSESEREIRVVAAENAALISHDAPSFERKCPTEFYMFETDHTLIDCGMCLITRCADGSFFIVDSGHYYQFNDNDRLHRFLRERTPEGEKIVIAGWLITHGHSDHISKFSDFLKYNLDDVSLERVYINLISDKYRRDTWSDEEVAMCRCLLDLLEDLPAEKIKLHTGQHFCVRNLTFDVLCTHEDVYPHPCDDYNNSSTVLMMTAEGSRVLITGDASGIESEIMVKRYGELLKSDVVQVAHHGHIGASERFYELVDADTALFATTQIKFDEELPRLAPNRVAIATAKEHFISSNGTVKIPLPYKFGQTECLPDETFEDFDKINGLWGYEYTDERKNELFELFVSNGGRLENLSINPYLTFKR